MLSNQCHIRPYAPPDWPRIAAVHDAARLDELRDSVGAEAFLTLAETGEAEGLFDGEVWVAEAGAEIAGFSAFADRELTWLYVHPRFYRRGIGRALLLHAIERSGGEMTTEVLVGNAAALALYRSVGFDIVKTTTGKLVGNERFAASGHQMKVSKGAPDDAR